MTTIAQNTSPAQPWYEPFTSPVALTIMAIVYAVLVTLSLFVVPRADPLFNLVSMVTFSAFVITPVIFLSLPISKLYRGVLIGIGLLVIMPIIGIYFPEYLEVVIQICIFASLALGLNMVVGYAGLLNLGYAAFFAVGAYLWGMLTSTANTIFRQSGLIFTSNEIFFVMILGAALAGLFAIFLGVPVLRLRGDYLAIVTLGFGEIIRVVARNLDRPVNWTNGALGLNNIAAVPSQWLTPTTSNAIVFLDANVRSLRIERVDVVSNNLTVYLMSIALLMLFVYISRTLENSMIGRAWTAIREDEIAAEAMGVPLLGMKLRAFALGAAFGGAVGVLFSGKQSFIDPNSFLLLASISILAIVILGGMGGVKGVVVGAVIVKLLELHILTNIGLQINQMRNTGTEILGFNMSNLSAELEPTRFKPLIFGLILVLMMIFRPEGLLPARRRRLEIQESREQNAATA
jgi:branched-chain amino acid transport system permease protein